MSLTIFIFAFLMGYLSGSIPFGLLVAKIGGAGDVRSIGSGNIGATNVLRTGRKGLALTTLLFDVMKGFVPVMTFLSLGGGEPTLAVLAGLGAFLGHLYPVWLKGKGGKGVATYLGVLAGFSWWGVVVFAVVWLATAYASKYSSLAALLAAVAVPIALWSSPAIAPAVTGLFLVMSALIFWRHRANIDRLTNHREPKIGAKKTDEPA
ncbi:glycerol-3-phosphate 1-O-acyltransferase PlsY [Ahrensia sp. R2A130]|uniref:glycerol-3-phosphate 1-O-acyltransferase PlsY n=1 Tax=Ahrensia sp. R2A130 TaxID=744979 RepID=UPI0001E0D0A7|nr:glycerol-3-phosphate 1-O-acyltransferase PlsY [Ahrensia sp. R2A130]EFL90294.1 acyl-phosphate glycerol 3-phosphate acyltransferase [Ahrensia sp. R2A130]